MPEAALIRDTARSQRHLSISLGGHAPARSGCIVGGAVLVLPERGPAKRAVTERCKSRRMIEDVSLTGPPAVMGFRPCGPRNPGPRFETGQY